MKAKLVRVSEDEQTRYDVKLILEPSDAADSLLIYTQCLKRVDGAAIMVDSGEVIPEIPLDGSHPSLDKELELGFFNSFEDVHANERVTGEFVAHWFKPTVVWLEKVKFTGPADKISLAIGKADSKKVEVIGQYSKFTVESGKSKKIEFLETGVTVRNPGDNAIYLTYYVAASENTLSGHLGRIGLELLHPKDVKTISMALHHDQVCESLSMKACKVGDLPQMTMYPFLVAYTDMRTEHFDLTVT